MRLSWLSAHPRTAEIIFSSFMAYKATICPKVFYAMHHIHIVLSHLFPKYHNRGWEPHLIPARFLFPLELYRFSFFRHLSFSVVLPLTYFFINLYRRVLFAPIASILPCSCNSWRSCLALRSLTSKRAQTSLHVHSDCSDKYWKILSSCCCAFIGTFLSALFIGIFLQCFLVINLYSYL